MSGNIDGGRAHFVLLTLHVTYILVAGTSKGLGVLLPSLKEHFDTHTWLVGSIISFMMTVTDFSCKKIIPFCSPGLSQYRTNTNLLKFENSWSFRKFLTAQGTTTGL